MPQAPALIEPSVKALDEAIEALEGATRAVEVALAACDFDPSELERCEERLFALRAWPQIRDADRAVCRRWRKNTPTSSPRSRPAAARSPRLEAEARAAARPPMPPRRARSARREESARALERAVNGRTPAAQARARRVPRRSHARRRARRRPTGYDRAEFLVHTNPGSRPGPADEGRLGGELARFLLALKVCLAERGTAPTLVFDEIDTGVGGAVADAIGQRLARLAARAQVLAVTHAPQVAARSQSHFRIVKSDGRQGRARRDQRGARSAPASVARRSPACSPAPKSPTRRGRPP